MGCKPVLKSVSAIIGHRKHTMFEILAIIAIYFTGVAVFGAVPINSDFEPASDGIRLCVRTNGIHADIVVPSVSDIVDWQIQHPIQHFPALTTPYDYISFGWGDRGFYLYAPTWSELTVGTALTAVSGLGSAALHVEYIDTIASDETTACTRISSEQYRVLAEYIRSTFKVDSAGAVILIDAPGYTESDAFYEAQGAYHIFTTCNEWVRRGLSVSGVRTAAWSPFDGALLRQLRAVSTDTQESLP